MPKCRYEGKYSHIELLQRCRSFNPDFEGSKKGLRRHRGILCRTCGHCDRILQPAASVPCCRSGSAAKSTSALRANQGCGLGRSDSVETSAGTIRGFKRNGVYLRERKTLH